MKKRMMILLIFFLFFFIYSQEGRFHNYPSTIAELFKQLDEKYTFQQEDIDAPSFDTLLYWKYMPTIGSYISDCLFRSDAGLLTNINPNNWRIHKETYVPVIMEAYWSYLKGINFNLDLKFECDDRYLKSGDEPIIFPQVNLIRDSSYISIEYLYKGCSCSEDVYYYRTGIDNLLYLYSYHFGWFLITDEEDEQMMNSGKYEEEIWNILQTQEKLVF